MTSVLSENVEGKQMMDAGTHALTGEANKAPKAMSGWNEFFEWLRDDVSTARRKSFFGIIYHINEGLVSFRELFFIDNERFCLSILQYG